MDPNIDTTDDIYRLTGVSKAYHKSGRDILAVRELDLDIRQGEWLAVQGKTGHGKTTLLQLLGGLTGRRRAGWSSPGRIWPPRPKRRSGR